MMQSTSIPSSKPSAQQTDFKSEKHGSPVSPCLDEPPVRPTAHQPRIEPWLGAVHSDRKPTYDELRALVAQYDVPAPRKRPFARAGIVTTIFVVGSALGFGIASLLGEESGQALRISSRHVVDARPSGSSAGELPYDGRINVASKSQQSQDGSNKDELPYGGEKPDAAAIGKIDGSAAPPRSQLVPAVPTSSKAGVSSIQESRSESRSRPETLGAGKKSIPVHQRPHVARRTNKDREIERIKQQAAEELKKKAESRRSAIEARHASKEKTKAEQHKTTTAHSARVPAMAALLEQCEQAGNFIRREQCKWQLCGGKWGKNGCPSYPSRTSLY
jgi:hypothetical protein